MSGGAYDYLCLKETGGVIDNIDEVARMAVRLKELGHDDLAFKTQKIIDAAEELEKQIDELRNVWKAVEWYDSGDWGIEAIHREANRVRERRPGE